MDKGMENLKSKSQKNQKNTKIAKKLLHAKITTTMSTFLKVTSSWTTLGQF